MKRTLIQVSYDDNHKANAGCLINANIDATHLAKIASIFDKVKNKKYGYIN